MNKDEWERKTNQLEWAFHMHALNQVWSMRPVTEQHRHRRWHTPHAHVYAHAKHFFISPRFPTPVAHITNYPFPKKVYACREGTHLSTLNTGLQIFSQTFPFRDTLTAGWTSTVKVFPEVLFLCAFVIVSVDQISSTLYCRSDRNMQAMCLCLPVVLIYSIICMSF